MKRIILIGIVIGLLLLTGCTSWDTIVKNCSSKEYDEPCGRIKCMYDQSSGYTTHDTVTHQYEMCLLKEEIKLLQVCSEVS